MKSFKCTYNVSICCTDMTSPWAFSAACFPLLWLSTLNSAALQEEERAYQAIWQEWSSGSLGWQWSQPKKFLKHLAAPVPLSALPGRQWITKQTNGWCTSKIQDMHVREIYRSMGSWDSIEEIMRINNFLFLAQWSQTGGERKLAFFHSWWIELLLSPYTAFLC